MQHKELSRRLRKLSKAITAHVDSPNLGGCAVIAGIVGERLEALGFKVEVVTPCSEWSIPPCKARGNVHRKDLPSEWRSEGVSHHHLAVRFRSHGRTYTWDSDRLYRKCDQFGRHGDRTDRKFGTGHTVAEAKALGAKQRGWNSTFDRKQIPLIRTLADMHLKYGL